MDFNSQEYANGRYCYKIPMRFWRISGITSHDFGVWNPWHRPYSFIATSDGLPQSIPESAYCCIHDDAGPQHLLIPSTESAKVFEALILVGETLSTCSRVLKYLTLYKAYECLTDTPVPEFSSIRHAIAHPEISLTRPRTLTTLINVFGSPTVDLKKHTHIRKFYKYLGQLFIETDKLLYNEIIYGMKNWIKIPNERYALMDWKAKALLEQNTAFLSP